LFHMGGTLVRASTWVLLLGVSVLSLSACTTTKVRTFSAPSLAATTIESIAIVPFQHTRFGPDIALSLSRSIGQAFAARNPRMRIVGPAEAQALLGAANLVEVYAQFVRDYRTSGLLNKGALHQVHDALNVDAILSGYITSVVQLDGAPHRPAFTQLTLTYALIGLRPGVLLWDTAATVSMERTVFDKAPDVDEGLPKAQESISAHLPTLPYKMGRTDY
jgi:hypothetical protein